MTDVHQPDHPARERDDPRPTCPECGSREIGCGYGLAGGGIGGYMYCESCGHVYDKTQDHG